MDSVTFTRELNKYKVVRLADHTKIRWKTQRKPDQKPKLLSGPTTSTIKSAATTNGEEDFYTMFQRINANALSEADMIKLIAAMKQEHPGMVGSVNLDDLEHLASLLLK